MTHPRLDRLTAGMLIPFGGNRAAAVPPALADAFRAGDHLLIVQDTGDLLHIPAAEIARAADAVGRAAAAFAQMCAVTDDAITRFFDVFAQQLENEPAWHAIADANAADVSAARLAGRSTTRLQATARMRVEMIAGLRSWRDAPPSRGRSIGHIRHAGWTLDQIAAPLGIVGFVFEGRPNVFADAAGVLRSGNTAVFRIGSDALRTAQAILRHAVQPALGEAGLPDGALCLLESADRAAGWALFADRRLAMAVARGSGRAVAQLGSVARQSGIAVSLHGTGGAWMIADHDANAMRFAAAVRHSLDRKVCNTLNVCCIHRACAADLVPVFLDALQDAGKLRGFGSKLHVVAGGEAFSPAAWRQAHVQVRRASGELLEPQMDVLREDELGREWEWEETPEVTLTIVDDLEQAVALFNRYSPRFTASLISDSAETQDRFFTAINAPFVGDGFTRWVDGQYALNQPELGLSNWENGRLLARSAILSGDGVFTVRSRARQTDINIHR
jgi:glutamate-5-semialdehyde dehydrogenase